QSESLVVALPALAAEPMISLCDLKRRLLAQSDVRTVTVIVRYSSSAGTSHFAFRIPTLLAEHSGLFELRAQRNSDCRRSRGRGRSRRAYPSLHRSRS